MKKLILSGIILAAMGVTIISCNKENVEIETRPTEKVNPEVTVTPQDNAKSDIANALFILNETNQKVKMKDVKSSDETHFFYQFEGENFAFTNDVSFLKWANKKESRSIFIEKYNYYKAQQQMAIETGMIDDEEATQRYTDELVANASSDDRILLSLLFDNQNYSKVLLPVIVAYPTMGGQKNRAESMWMPINAGALCDKTWFRGDKFWYWAIPAGGIPTFGSMNNRAESIF